MSLLSQAPWRRDGRHVWLLNNTNCDPAVIALGLCRDGLWIWDYIRYNRDKVKPVLFYKCVLRLWQCFELFGVQQR